MMEEEEEEEEERLSGRDGLWIPSIAAELP